MLKKIKHITFLSLLIPCSYTTFGQAKDTIVYSTPKQVKEKELPDALKRLLNLYDKDTSKASILKFEDFDLDGLLIDETMTKLGRDFYSLYFDTWQAPQKASDYTIFIKEKPMPGMGNLIEVKINDDLIFSNRLSPKASAIEALVFYAVQASMEYLMTRDQLGDQLDGEDMKGTGFY